MTLKTEGLQMLEQVRAFLEGSDPLGFQVRSRLRAPGASSNKSCGSSTMFRQGGRIRDRRGPPAKSFLRCYTTEDVRLVAEIYALLGYAGAVRAAPRRSPSCADPGTAASAPTVNSGPWLSPRRKHFGRSRHPGMATGRPGKPPDGRAILPFVRYFLATGLVELCVWMIFQSPPTRRKRNVS